MQVAVMLQRPCSASRYRAERGVFWRTSAEGDDIGGVADKIEGERPRIAVQWTPEDFRQHPDIEVPQFEPMMLLEHKISAVF
jgi:hypothetical protein